MILFVAFRVKATFAPECRGVGSLELPAILWHLQLARGAATMVV